MAYHRRQSRIRGIRLVWSAANYAFLERVHLADVTRSNAELADLCTSEFGRKINVNAIRGGLNRLRERGRVPKYRPGRKLPVKKFPISGNQSPDESSSGVALTGCD